jgi:hypothetical protein
MSLEGYTASLDREQRCRPGEWANCTPDVVARGSTQACILMLAGISLLTMDRTLLDVG